MKHNEIEYWDRRANKKYIYRGEKFYTITPIPCYYKRRKIIINLLMKILNESKAESIYDYGCGDGEYLKLLAGYITDEEGQKVFGGGDISADMIELAKRSCRCIKGISLEIAGNGIPTEKCYDIVYSVAVYAHIDDRIVNNIFNNIKNHLTSKGYFIICEQVGTRRIEGETYIRRTIAEYRNMLEEAGFSIKEICLIDIWAHRIFFERHLAKIFYKKMSASSDHDRRIEANTHFLFKVCSGFFTKCSIPCIFNKDSGWGYVFIVAEKA